MVASGVRYDLAVKLPAYIKELVEPPCRRLPQDRARAHRRGPAFQDDEAGHRQPTTASSSCSTRRRRRAKEYYLIPYFIAAHPGTTDEDMMHLALWLKRNNYRADQVQTFLPSPMALSTAMYHSGVNPLKPVRRGGSETVDTVKGIKQRRLHKAFLRYHDAENAAAARRSCSSGPARPCGPWSRVPGPTGTSTAGQPCRGEAATRPAAPAIFQNPLKDRYATCMALPFPDSLVFSNHRSSPRANPRLFHFALVTGLVGLLTGSGACSSTTAQGTGSGGSSGGASQSGGSSTKASSGGSSGGTSSSSSSSSTSSSSATAGQTSSSSSSGGASSSGGTSSSSDSTTSGGSSSSGGSSGGTTNTTTSAGGTTGSSSSTGGSTGTGVSYLLPPPDRCHDQDYIPYDYATQTGCKDGDKTTDCGGKCQVINACSETTSAKPNADVTFMCQRNLLFSPEMEQAVADDGNTGFHYAVVGHDVDKGGIDGNDQSACCQCYQLVYAWPSPANDRQVQLNPDKPDPPASAIPVPPPLIVQAFNTAATPQTFDVYMPAGGLGANNACAKVAGSTSQSGQYMYTSYPPDGQPSQGGVKPVSLYSECKTDIQWVTTESLSKPACQQKISDACNQIKSNIPGLTEQAQKTCLKANSLDTMYHLNWSVYAAKVECPEHLTRVTGCKLAPQGLPTVKKDVTTAAQASKDSAFWTKTGSTSNLYETTTMEDCCRPSCAAINWISGRGLKADDQYRAFYTCDANGVPYTQKQ